MKKVLIYSFIALVLFGIFRVASSKETELGDQEFENLVRRSYQYVALYNTLNNFVYSDQNPFASGGWNKTHYPKGLMDASVHAIPRPNNDTLYVLSMLDLRDDAVVIRYPAFQSKYVSLETSAFDHYCDIPLATSKGDFKEATNVLYYSDLTKGYTGEPVKGIDKTVKMSGDFAVAFLRVMPEAQDKEKFEQNMAAIREVKLQTLNEFKGLPAKAAPSEKAPAYGNDEMVFSNNFQEVLQFVFNQSKNWSVLSRIL